MLDCPSVLHSLFIVDHSCDCGAVNTSIVATVVSNMSYMDYHFPSNIGVIAAACHDLKIAFKLSSAIITSAEIKEISLDHSSSDYDSVYTTAVMVRSDNECEW